MTSHDTVCNGAVGRQEFSTTAALTVGPTARQFTGALILSRLAFPQ